DVAVTPGGLDVEVLARQPDGILSRTLKGWIEASGVSHVTSSHVAELCRLVRDWRGQGPIDLPGGYRVRRASGTLCLIPPTNGDATEVDQEVVCPSSTLKSRPPWSRPTTFRARSKSSRRRSMPTMPIES